MEQTQQSTEDSATALAKQIAAKATTVILAIIEDLEASSVVEPKRAAALLEAAFRSMRGGYVEISDPSKSLTVGAHVADLLLILYFRFAGDWPKMRRFMSENRLEDDVR